METPPPETGPTSAPKRPGTSPWLRWAAVVAVALVLALGIDLGKRALASDRVQWQTWASGNGNGLDVAAVGSAGAPPLRLVRFTADWCGPCQDMKADVFSRRDVADAIHAGFRPVSVDLTAPAPRDAALAQRYAVDFIPTLLVLDPSGLVRGRYTEPRDPDGLLDWLAKF
ncbi:MAG: thioredoxin fold domain-containing protein [Planctomycetota bacterium]